MVPKSAQNSSLLHSLSVSSQAFVDAIAADNPALSYRADGVLGLGFTQLSSVDSLLNRTKQSTGRSLLYNLFSTNLSQPNFIAFSLQRSNDTGNDLQGSISIGIHCTSYIPQAWLNVRLGQIEPQFANVSNSPSISTWPVVEPTRWSILIDAMITNNTITVPTSTVSGAPSNKAVALIDSGSS